jgi:ATP synthase protein I
MAKLDQKSKKDALSERLDALKKDKEQEHLVDDHYSQAHLAWRMVIELVAGLAIGFGIGWGLDYLFNSQPLFMIIFILLGLAAGINVMLKTAKEIGKDKALSEESLNKEDNKLGR